MKKFIVLMLTLSLPSLAKAMTLQIAVDGRPTDGIFMFAPSDTITLGIYSPDGCTADD